MTFYISHHEPEVRLGLGRCPGVLERGHRLTMRTVHDGTCCQAWASGVTPSPDRAEAFREAAERWWSTWPKPEPEAGS